MKATENSQPLEPGSTVSQNLIAYVKTDCKMTTCMITGNAESRTLHQIADVGITMGDLVAARDRFLVSGEIGRQVRPMVRRSWLRCEAYGVDPKQSRRQFVNPAQIEEAQAKNKRLLAVAEPLIAFAHDTLAAQPHLIALADNEGRILRLMTDSVTGKMPLDETNLFEGASWHERDIGCNGVGTALAEENPLILIGPEHYQESYVEWTCIGVPLRTPDRKIVGALDLSVPNRYVSIHTWGWTLSLAQAIEARLAGIASSEDSFSLHVVEDPFHAVRGVLDLLTSQLEAASTHKEFLDGARLQVEEASDRLRATVAQLLSTQNELRLADRRKDDFIADLSHELRNPLNSIALTIPLIRNSGEDRDLVEESCSILEGQVSLMTRLIDDLLDLSRIREAKISLQKHRVDLCSVTRKALGAFTDLATTRNHRLITSISEEPICAVVDPHRFQQILGNLFANAAKFTDPGGEIHVSLKAEGDEVVLRVKDTGVGLSPELLRSLFTRYSQSPTTKHRSRGGLGIGLALAKGLVELHGGTIAAKSDGPGRGSEFIVRLPLD